MSKDDVANAFIDLLAQKVADILEERRNGVARPKPESETKPAGKPATEKQAALLRSWRNQGQLRAALAAVTGDGTTPIEDLTAREASSVLDFMLPPRKGSTRAYAS